jgi:hypothetical protein
VIVTFSADGLPARFCVTYSFATQLVDGAPAAGYDSWTTAFAVLPVVLVIWAPPPTRVVPTEQVAVEFPLTVPVSSPPVPVTVTALPATRVTFDRPPVLP